MPFDNILVNPLIWGPPTWYVIHLLGYTYDENKKDLYIRFFNKFKDIIPCPRCKKIITYISKTIQ